MKKPIGAVSIHSAVLLLSANTANNTVVTIFPIISQPINHGTFRNLDIIIPEVEMEMSNYYVHGDAPQDEVLPYGPSLPTCDF